MSTALAKLSEITGATSEEVNEVVKGMIISSKAQHGATASNAEMAVVVGTCARYGLNPLTKEAHAFISGGKLQMIVGVDGWSKIMNRQPNFDGIEFDDTIGADGKITAITAKIYIKDRSRPVCITEYLAECNDIKSTVWKKFPCRMLRHKAMIQCCRIAFGISEVIDDDEKNRIVSNSPAERDITPQPSVNFADINTIMNDCDNLESLKSACGDIRKQMQTNGTWDSNKAEIIALNVKHKDRINSIDEKPEVIYDEETGEEMQTDKQTESSETEAIEGELLAADDAIAKAEDDIGFGDDETDEFGE